MSELTEYIKVLSEAIAVKNEWLEKFELPKLKESLRVFQSSYSALYAAFLKKGLINEDPYKQEAKVGEIIVPDVDAFPENEATEKLTIRFASFDIQLDFLVNFYQFSIDFLTLDRIKSIYGLIKFINWTHLSPSSDSINTRYTAMFIQKIRIGLDPLSLNLISESTTNLIKSTAIITASLKTITDFNKEAYKLMVRTAITSTFPEGEIPNLTQIKKKFIKTLANKPFYPEFIEDIIREDYTKDGKNLRDEILNALKIIDKDKKDKKEKNAISLKSILIEGVQSFGSIATVLTEIGVKLDENEMLLTNKRKSFAEKLKRIINQVINREPEPSIYELQYTDLATGGIIREKVNYANFRSDVEKRVKNLIHLGESRGAVAAKLEALPEDQLIGFLDRNIQDIQNLYKTLTALDEYFKANVDKDDRFKIKGIKPELSTIKNAMVRANQKRHDYNAQKEETEQFKKLGIDVDE